MDKETVKIVNVAMSPSGRGVFYVLYCNGLAEIPFDMVARPFDIEDVKMVIADGLSRLRVVRKLAQDLEPWYNKDLEVDIP